MSGLDSKEYEIRETLHAGRRSMVYRAREVATDRSVIVKTPTAPASDVAERNTYRKVREIMQQVEHPGVPRLLNLIDEPDFLALVTEDIGGLSVRRWRALADSEREVPGASQGILLQPLPVDTFMRLALSICEALCALHSAGVIHKDLKPSNVIINPATGRVQIIDFDQSTTLSRVMPSAAHPRTLGGTLFYMSPEQTGRINRHVDLRTDLYSLGVIFFQLLTGQLPFKAEDALGWVHAHIAQRPPAPCELNFSIPSILSTLVLKLLEKNPEGRYFSCEGLLHDLQRCEEAFRNGESLHGFTLGEADFNRQFTIPQKLYGREHECAEILDRFAQVQQGNPRLCLVSGDPGIGKTSIVQELHKPIVACDGLYGAGKFDQFQRTVPYFGLRGALSEVIEDLMHEVPESLAQVTSTLKAELGSGAADLVRIIPEVERIIGPQPAAPEVSAQQARVRLMGLLQKLVRTIGRVHPIVLFLDDLQWADLSSLDVLQPLLTDPESRLFLIGAYRDREVDSTHPLARTLDALEQAGCRIDRIHLETLTREHIASLLADAMGRKDQEPDGLARLILRKTAGNPFFIIEFLRTLYSDDLIRFDPVKRSWVWDLQQIEDQNITNNVVDLLLQRMEKLPEISRQALQIAACIGTTFDLEILALVAEENVRILEMDLWPAVKAELLSQRGGLDTLGMRRAEGRVNVVSRFVHDRILQSAYESMSPDARQKIHLRIGRMLLKERDCSGDTAGQLFSIVNHLNTASDLIGDEAERLRLVKLNLEAGDQALASSAHQPAYDYLVCAERLLGEKAWKRHYPLMLELQLKLNDCLFAMGSTREAMPHLHEVLAHAREDFDRARAHARATLQHAAEGDYDQAILSGKQGLRCCGETFPDNEKKLLAVLPQMVADIKALAASGEAERILKGAEMSDPGKRLAMEILPHVALADLLSGHPRWASLWVLHGTLMSYRHGVMDLSANNLAGCSAVLVTGGRYEEAVRFARLALDITERFTPCRQVSSTCNSVGSRAAALTITPDRILKLFEHGYRVGREEGEAMYSALNLANLAHYTLALGLPLADLRRRIRHLADFNSKHDIWFAGVVEELYTRLADVLTGKAGWEQMLEASFPEPLRHLEGTTQIGFLRCLQFSAAFWLDQPLPPDVVAKYASEAALIEGYLNKFEFDFLRALSWAMQVEIDEGASPNRERFNEQIRLQRRLAGLNAVIFLPQLALLEAEEARMRGDLWAAREGYRRALHAARKAGMLPYEALANERLARFWERMGESRYSALHLKDAVALYREWGCEARVAKLRRDFARWSAEMSGNAYGEESIFATLNVFGESISSSHDALDLATVMKSAQAIAEEMDIDGLLSRIVRVVIENAGAERGYLLVEDKDKQPVIAARAEVGKGSQDVTPEMAKAAETDPGELLPMSVIHYVQSADTELILSNALSDAQYATDPVVEQRGIRSVLCLPMRHRDRRVGILYLENNVTTRAFRREHVETLKILSAQAAISVVNARLFRDVRDLNLNLEAKVEERTGELRQAQAQLVESEKMASLGQLVAGVAHEINTPVGVGLTSASMLEGEFRQLQSAVDSGTLRRSDLDKFLERGTQAVNLVLTNLERSARLVASFKQVAVDQSVEEERSFALRDYIESVLLSLGPQLHESRHRVELEGDAQLKVRSYPGVFAQLFTNLVTNSLLHGFNGKNDPGQIRIRFAAQDGELKILYTDDGKGMSEEIRSHVFDPFVTTRRGQGGTGLGMHIVYNLVTQKLGGRIACESSPGKGVQFSIDLPLVTEN